MDKMDDYIDAYSAYMSLYSGSATGIRGRWRKRAHLWNREDPGDCSAKITPDMAIAGRRETFNLELEVGESGIEKGGWVAIFLPRYCGLTDVFNLRFVQGEAGEPGYGARITGYTNREDVSLLTRIHTTGSLCTVIEHIVKRGNLKHKDKIFTILGHPDGVKFRVQEHAKDMVFSIAVDRKGKGDWLRVKEYPCVKVVGDLADRFRVTIPAIPSLGEPFSIRITAVDKINGSPSYYYEGKVKIESTEGKIEVPKEGKFELDQHGIITMEKGICLSGDKGNILVLDTKLGISGKSNPIKPNFIKDDLHLYFGDIHARTGLSGSAGAPEEYFFWARDVEHLDFCASGDYYDEAGLYTIKAQEKWEWINRVVKEYNEPGRFVTLPGYETHSTDGHRNVYYKNVEEALFPGENQCNIGKTRNSLFKVLEGRECLIIPHHPKYCNPINWSYPSHPQERLVEIYSTWTSSEEGSVHSVQAALVQEHKLGIIAGSDNHIAEPGHHIYYPGEGGGLAAVFASELTRDAIFQALFDRYCYGTTGARILLDFTINGYRMGKEFSTGGDRKIEVKVIGTSPIIKIEIIKDNQILKEYKLKEDEVNVSYIDKEKLNKESFYYVRVTQLDGHMAWSSPIWVERN